ncbi:MAG: hypothetical protein XD92_1191, partial [Proteiniphilum acetatigenes]
CDPCLFQLKKDRTYQLVGQQSKVKMSHCSLIRFMKHGAQAQISFRANDFFRICRPWGAFVNR